MFLSLLGTVALLISHFGIILLYLRELLISELIRRQLDFVASPTTDESHTKEQSYSYSNSFHKFPID